jgi:glutamine amidotransferase
MCRFLAYIGPNTTMEELLFNSSNSLVEQSRHAKLRFEPTNGDGFGVGWYPKHEDPEPGTFVSIEPAWSNRNLRQLASKVYTKRFFAHVRDASAGMPVSQSNCHPFQHGQYLWMHNGHLDQFELTRRSLINSLSDKAFEYIDGNTDSEHAFALFLDQINFKNKPSPADLENAVLNTLQKIIDLRQATLANSNANMNFAVSNGESAIFTRFASHEKHEPPSLHYLQQDNQIIISSEPLSKDLNWIAVERNHLLQLTPTGDLNIKAIELD